LLICSNYTDSSSNRNNRKGSCTEICTFS